MKAPNGPQGVHAAWLQAALRSEGAFPTALVRAVRAEVIGAGWGLASTVARLHLEAGGSAPRTMVAKWCDAEAGRREAGFYRELAPRLDLALPALHAVFPGSSSSTAVLLFEDIAPARQGDALVGATPAEAGALVEAAASLHALAWGTASRSLPAWIPEWNRDAELRTERTRRALPVFLDRYGDKLAPAVRRRAEGLADLEAEGWRRLREAPATLIHSDLHLDNVFFRPDGVPVVIDWAGACRGPGAVDLARLLSEGLASETRARHGAGLARRYLEALAARGVRGVDSEALARDVESALVVLFAGAVRWAVSESVGSGASARVEALAESLVARVGEALTTIPAPDG